MGQTCCAPTTNTQQIKPSDIEDKESFKTTHSKHHLPSQHQKIEIAQKENFYGKDGYKYSKTITKEMACNLDQNLQEYKKKIYAQQPIIEELSQQNSQSNHSSKARKKTQSQDAVDSYLQQLAECVAVTK